MLNRIPTLLYELKRKLEGKKNQLSTLLKLRKCNGNVYLHLLYIWLSTSDLVLALSTLTCTQTARVAFYFNNFNYICFTFPTHEKVTFSFYNLFFGVSSVMKIKLIYIVDSN